MSPTRLRSLTTPLFCRELVLRALLVSALANFSINVYSLCIFGVERTSTGYWLFAIILPLSIVLHHLFRVWPRKHWLTVFEALLSLVEAVTSGLLITSAKPLYPDAALSYLVDEISGLAMGGFSILASVFLSCDILTGLSMGLHTGTINNEETIQVDLFYFSIHMTLICTDNIFIQCIRGGLAVLCLLALSYLVIYAIIWQPLRWSGRPGIKTLELPISSGHMFSALDEFLGTPPNLVKAVLGTSAAMDAKVNMAVKVVSPSVPALPCQYDFSHVGSVLASCESLFTYGYCGLEALYFGLTNSTGDILANAEPVPFSPGSNLHGLASISIKERFSKQVTATLGVPQYRGIGILNVHSLSPDQSPSLPRDNNTATLRITMLPQHSIKIEQEYLESSILNGFALVGGAWTLINGVFAAIFGTTLLLVLFGIKPLSIYGLVHRFQKGQTSLVDREYVLPPEEREYTVGILREHLMDVGDEEAWKSV